MKRRKKKRFMCPVASLQVIFSLMAAPLCVVCGLYGDKSCSKCHKTLYCSRAHQAVHWTLGQHRTKCNTSNPDDLSAIDEKYLFKEHEITHETETETEKPSESLDITVSTNEGFKIL